jgi:nitroreductase
MHELFERRHCVRSFQPRHPGRQQISTILAAAASAPSAGDLKAREVLVIEDEAVRAKLVDAALGQEFIGQAPVVLVFWAVASRSAEKYGERGRDLFSLQDATIAASFAWLQAVALGLGCCWVGAFDDQRVKRIFRHEIEDDWRPVAILPVGYPAD